MSRVAIAKADRGRRRRHQGHAGGEAVAPAITRQIRVADGDETAKERDKSAHAVVEAGFGELDLHADADADPVVEAIGDAGARVVGAQERGAGSIIATGPKFGEVLRKAEWRVDRHAEPKTRIELV